MDTLRLQIILDGFNPRPLLLTGESFTLAADSTDHPPVSIHARYC